jgi:hypothetical protein
VTTPDGFSLALQEWNRRPLAAGTPTTRVDPPMTTDQMVAVVTDPRWTEVERAIVEFDARTAPGADKPFFPDPASGSAPAKDVSSNLHQ